MEHTRPAHPPPDPGVAGARVVTPEAVPLALEAATVGSRGVAYVLDLLLIGAGLTIIGLGQAALTAGGVTPGWLGIAILLVAAFVLQFGYPIGFETLRRGRTPGKAALGLRVVTVEGAPVGLRHATLRATVGLLELPLTVGLLAVVSSFSSRRGQRLGDLAAGTLVVREGRGRSVEASRFVPPPGLEEYAAHLDTSRIGAPEYATLRETLRRLPTLPAQTRHAIATQVADRLLPLTSPAPPAGISAEQWLVCVAAAVQRVGARTRPVADQRTAMASRTPATAPQPPDDGFAPPG